MSDKLLVEIDMFNSELNDAIPALIFLANELVESGTIEISNPVNWNEKKGNAYQVKWRFSEDELHMPFDIDFLYELNDELKKIKRNISKNKNSAILNLQTRLEACLKENGVGK
ncbi:MAG: hypothetical protein JWM96_1389 [Alphaproteobacteria bacterium]|nr:hypothetical protein [Alphaproteobacteria bacterium]